MENTWLSKSPRSMHCIFDYGREYTGAGFQELYKDMESTHILPLLKISVKHINRHTRKLMDTKQG